MSIFVPDFAIPFLILLLNCLHFKLLRVFAFKLIPTFIRPTITELISTVELCSDCAELGVVWEKNGDIVFGITLFLLCLWWSHSFDDAEACPCGPIEDSILAGSSSETGQKLLGQLLGAYITAKYTNCFWCWHLTEEHQQLHTKRCVATLQVPVLYGALIEGLITFISRLVALESVEWPVSVANVINAATTVLLVLCALNTTGGYFNPVMASALTLNCKGNSVFEHVMVYWVGSLTGGFFARLLQLLIRGDVKAKSD